MSYLTVTPSNIKLGYAWESSYGSNYNITGITLNPFNNCESFSLPVAYQSIEEKPHVGFAVGQQFINLKRESGEEEITTYLQDADFFGKLFNNTFIGANKILPSFVLAKEESSVSLVSYGCFIKEYTILAEDGYFIREKMRVKCSLTKRHNIDYPNPCLKSTEPIPSTKLALQLKVGVDYIDLPAIEKLSLTTIYNSIDTSTYGGVYAYLPICSNIKFDLKLTTFFMDLVGDSTSPVNRIFGILIPTSTDAHVNIASRKLSFKITITVGTITHTLILDNLYLNTETSKETVMDGLKKFELSFISGNDTAYSYST